MRIKLTNMKRMISLILALLAAGAFASAQNISSIEMQTLDGGKTTPAEWVDGRTPYVVSFWFVTCKFCIEEMDAISEVFEEWQKEKPFRFIAVCTDDARSLARAKALVKGRDWDAYHFASTSTRSSPGR